MVEEEPVMVRRRCEGGEGEGLARTGVDLMLWMPWTVSASESLTATGTAIAAGSQKHAAPA